MCIRRLHYYIHFMMRNCYHLVRYSRLAILLWTLLIVVLCNYSPCFGCPLEEYETLIKLKSSILHNNKTSPHTWGKGRDCCLWERVTCTNNTQQVSKLNLSSLLDLAYGQLNFSIFSSFHELRLLNLSNNAIGGLQSQTGQLFLSQLLYAISSAYSFLYHFVVIIFDIDSLLWELGI